MLRSVPQPRRLPSGLAVLLVDTARSDRAFALLKNWSQRSPNLSDARVELARLHQEFNQNKVAEQYLDEALAMDPRNAKAWAARGKMRENSGELMQAVQNYQQSLAINASQPDLFQRISALNVRISQGPAVPPQETSSPGTLVHLVPPRRPVLQRIQNATRADRENRRIMPGRVNQTMLTRDYGGNITGSISSARRPTLSLVFCRAN